MPKFSIQQNFISILAFFLVILGVADALTTVEGTIRFGYQYEANPLMANLLSIHIYLFLAIKLTLTAVIGVFFVVCERLLLKRDRNETYWVFAYDLLRFSATGLIVFMSFIVSHNLFVLFW